MQVVEVACKSVLNAVRGMPFAWSINPYQGCYHGCVFCYARATHRYRELDGVVAWSNRLTAKVNAPEVLRAELARPSWRGEHVAIGTATDPYQPIEGRYRITRRILIELARAETPAHLITRSPLIVRDLDVLRDLARAAPFSVAISLPTVDAELARRIEPTVAPPHQRLRTVRRLADAGICVGVAIAPILPGLTDTVEALRAVATAAAAAGAASLWHAPLNLGEVTRESMFVFLEREQPQLLAAYRSLYRRRYLDTDAAREIERRFAKARAAIALSPPPAVTVAPSRVLALPFTVPATHLAKAARTRRG